MNSKLTAAPAMEEAKEEEDYASLIYQGYQGRMCG
jgi:hypothetical protein